MPAIIAKVNSQPCSHQARHVRALPVPTQENQTVNEKSQREKAEEWLDLNMSRFPHEDDDQVRVMN